LSRPDVVSFTNLGWQNDLALCRYRCFHVR
jgi:hypothetical protein